MSVPRALTIAGSDSGGGAGIQADLKAFAAAGAYGMSAIVALTAQNTVGVTAVHEVPVEIVTAQIDAVFDDLGVDAVKTGMLGSRAVIDAVADALATRGVPLVVDPVLIATSGARLLAADAADALVDAALSARDGRDAEPGGGAGAHRHAAPRRRPSSPSAWSSSAPRRRSSPAGTASRSTTSSTGRTMCAIPVERLTVAATHGAGCTHSATLAALLARGLPLEDAARGASRAATDAVRHGLAELGAGDGPVDILNVKGHA